jgi:basic amino acid/polyamine antiporter, APA family
MASTTRTHKLLRIVGVVFGISVTIGGTIGVGILRTPGSVAAQLGSRWLIITIWLAGGLFAFLGTISVAELGTMLPETGGWYVYGRRAFGEYGGFIVGWSNWIAFSAALAALAISVGDLCGFLVSIISNQAKISAVLILVVFAFLHWHGLRWSSQVQNIASSVQALAFVAFIASCFLLGGTGHSPSVSQIPLRPPVGLTAILGAVAIALQSVIFTYDGWYGAIYFTEEDQNPARNLPRAMITGVLIIIAIYMLVIFSMLHVLPLPQLAASQFPAADTAQFILGKRGALAITLISLVCILSVINALILQTTRILFALSRDRLFSAKAAVLSAGGTPRRALFLTTLAASLLVASGTFQRLLTTTTFFFVLMYGSGFLALLILRKREPNLSRPFRVWFYPYTPLLALAMCFVVVAGIVISDGINSAYSFVMLAASYPIYRLLKKRETALSDLPKGLTVL